MWRAYLRPIYLSTININLSTGRMLVYFFLANIDTRMHSTYTRSNGPLQSLSIL